VFFDATFSVGATLSLTEQTPEMSRPDTFYKYRQDTSWTEEILKTGNVWLSTPNKLNDPLECKTGILPQGRKQKSIRQMEDAQMAGFLQSAIPSLEGKERFYSLSHRAARRWFKRLKTKTRTDKYAAIRSFLKDHGRKISRPAELFKHFESQLSAVGIFSMSARPDNQLMWAHYAKGHTGLVLGFRREKATKLDSDEHTFAVIYTDVKPIFSGGLHQSNFFFFGAWGKA
jgi:hypothetical protein